MKKLTVIFLSALLPISLAFAGQKPLPVDDLEYAFAGEVLEAEPLSESEMEEVEGEMFALIALALALWHLSKLI